MVGGMRAGAGAPALTMADVMQLLAQARDNKVEDIKRTISRGVPPNACNQMGQSALHIAALWGNIEAVEALIKLGANPNMPNMRGSTPLHFAAAAKKNVEETCQLLLLLGARKEALDGMGRAPYELASSDRVRALLGGPDPRIFELCSAGDAAGLQALLSAAQQDAAGMQGHVSVRVVDSDGRTPLNLAVNSGSLETVKVVLGKDPSVLDIPDASGDSALHVAAGAGHHDVLAYLLSLRPESLNAQNLDTSEYSAGNWVLNGEVVEPLDKTPLAVAVEAGDVAAARLLLDAGATVDVIDFEKRTPLLAALEEGQEEMVRLLLERGADPRTPSQDFISALHLLATRGPLGLIALLVAKGADPAATNSDGWTPLHLAARSGKADRAAALLEAGAPVDAVNRQGNTPLHLAAVNGHVPVVSLLLERKANKALLNAEGKAPADVARNDAVRAVLAG